jgi:hypothetical protein
MGPGITAEYLRELAKASLLRGESLVKDKDDEVLLQKFTTYIEAYCAEMKTTEHDILLNDELFERVYSIFHNITTRDLSASLVENANLYQAKQRASVNVY